MEHIISGPDGKLWFSEGLRSGSIGRLAVTGGTADQFPVIATSTNPYIAQLANGPDGNVWYTLTTNTASYVGVITPTGTVTNRRINGDPYVIGIAAGPDGNLWVSETYADLAQNYNGDTVLVSTVAGVMTPKTSPLIVIPWAIALGPDQNLWFTSGSGSQPAIGRLTTGGAVSVFSASGFSKSIVAGADGNLWFTESNANIVGRSTPSGVVMEYVIPTVGANAGDIAKGPDGNLWFTEYAANKLARITPSGSITEYAVAGNPQGITTGGDGNIWYAEAGASKIARFLVP